MSITFGFINGTPGHRIGITLGDSPERSVRIMDNMRDAEIAEALRELADMYVPAVAAAVAPNLAARLFRIEDDMPDVEGQDPIPLAQARIKPLAPGEPVGSRPLAAAEWQCVASALGLAVAMLESNSPEVIRAAQALAVSKVHELRS